MESSRALLRLPPHGAAKSFQVWYCILFHGEGMLRAQHDPNTSLVSTAANSGLSHREYQTPRTQHLTFVYPFHPPSILLIRQRILELALQVSQRGLFVPLYLSPST